MPRCQHFARLALCLAVTVSGCGTDVSTELSRDDIVPACHDVVAQSDDNESDLSVATQTGEQITAAQAQPDDWFEDVTALSGIDFTYRNGREAGRFYLIENFGGGAAMVDFDLDGDVDLFLTGGGTISADTGQIGGRPSVLFRNDGNCQFVDVTDTGGFAESPGYSQGCAVTDFNSDGFPDLLVCCYGRSQLYVNHGDGTFEEIADWARSTAEGVATAAAFGDIDRDGLPDLLLAFYTDWSPQTDIVCRGANRQRDLCGNTTYPGTACRLFHNSGDGSFDDWSQRAGIRPDAHGLGVVAADLNEDGWVDFFVASDGTPNQLYLGGPHMPLVESAHSSGVALGDFGATMANMGIAVGDYNGDGRPDIFVTTFDNEDSCLYRNLGEGLFVYSTMTAGLAGISRMHVKFGTSLTDFDGDGWLDLFVLNGSPLYSTGESPFKQVPELFRNDKGRRFEKISQQAGAFFREEHAGRGNAVGDLDDDGAPDIVTVQMNDPVRIQRNRFTPKNYVSVELRARHGEPDATGARATVEYAGRQIVRFVVRGEGFFSQFDPRLIFPVESDANVANVTVVWPSRNQERFCNLVVRRTHVLVEGRGAIDR
jgi:hypothetical protein